MKDEQTYRGPRSLWFQLQTGFYRHQNSSRSNTTCDKNTNWLSSSKLIMRENNSLNNSVFTPEWNSAELMSKTKVLVRTSDVLQKHFKHKWDGPTGFTENRSDHQLNNVSPFNQRFSQQTSVSETSPRLQATECNNIECQRSL